MEINQQKKNLNAKFVTITFKVLNMLSILTYCLMILSGLKQDHKDEFKKGIQGIGTYLKNSSANQCLQETCRIAFDGSLHCIKKASCKLEELKKYKYELPSPDTIIKPVNTAFKSIKTTAIILIGQFTEHISKNIVSVVNFTYGLLKNGFNILKKDVKILADFIKEVSSNIMNLTFMLYKQFITKSKNVWKHFNLRYTLRRFLVSSITFTIKTFRFFKNSMIQDIPDLFYKLRNLQSAQAIKYRFSQLRTGLSNWYISIIQQVEFELNEPYNMTIYEKNTLDTIPLENLKINIEKEQLYHSEETKETDELQPKSEEQRNEILIKKNANTQSSNEVKGCNLKADLRKKLGNATWYLLHTITLKYPEKPTLNEQTDMASFLVLLSRIFPCDECQGHFQKMIERERPDLSSRENFKRWMFKIHNIVNKRIHKPEYDYENLEKDYACGC